jgi:hydroxyacylglutathione hydrolase
MRPDRSSTIGAERRDNAALAYSDVDDFVMASISASATPRPPNMERIVELNVGPFVAAPPPLNELESLDGTTVVDVRPADDFAAGHVPGALNVPVDGGGFATKAAFLLDPSEQIALHAGSAEEARRAARSLNAVGFLELAGYVVDVETPERLVPVDVDELELLVAAGDVELLDVREKDERDHGYIAGSRHVPYRLLRAGGRDAVDGKRPIVTICESGARAAIAASVLAAAGVDVRPVLHGGVPDWQRRGGHTVEFRRCGT